MLKFSPTLASFALAEKPMPAKSKKLTDEAAAQMVRAARRSIDEADDSPISPEEQAVMDGMRREHGRPSKAEIKSFAQRLAKHSR